MTLTTYIVPPALPLLLLTLSLAHPSAILAQTTSSQELTHSISNQAASDILNSSLYNTGNKDTFQSTSQESATQKIETNNSSASTQNVNATANTGHNEASRNISIGGNAGIITTGDALIVTDIITAANSTTSQISPYGSSSNTDQDSLNTGDASTHQTSDSDTTYSYIRGNNNTVIYQTTNAEATTGENVADRNISLGGNAGVITTGNAGVTTNYLVAANSGVALIGGDSDSGGPGSGASIVALNTGDNARYTPSYSRLTQSALQSHNSAALTQTCGGGYSFSADGVCSAITGGNTSNRNISRNGDAGIINTGTAAVVVNLLASANEATSLIDNQTSSASLHSHSANTGDSAQFAARSTDVERSSSSVFQNAAVNQSVNALADTGHNTANRNISFGGDAGVITTGDALISVRLSALANTAESHLHSVWPN